VPSGGRLRQRLRSDDAAGARTVLDHRLLAPGLGQRLAERAREYVDRATGGIGYQDVDGLARKTVRARARGRQQQCRAHDETAEFLGQAQHAGNAPLALVGPCFVPPTPLIAIDPEQQRRGELGFSTNAHYFC